MLRVQLIIINGVSSITCNAGLGDLRQRKNCAASASIAEAWSTRHKQRKKSQRINYCEATTHSVVGVVDFAVLDAAPDQTQRIEREPLLRPHTPFCPTGNMAAAELGHKPAAPSIQTDPFADMDTWLAQTAADAVAAVEVDAADPAAAFAAAVAEKATDGCTNTAVVAGQNSDEPAAAAVAADVAVVAFDNFACGSS